jgi:hypothetical protein
MSVYSLYFYINCVDVLVYVANSRNTRNKYELVLVLSYFFYQLYNSV